jgi:hypothetical protein
MDWQNMFTMSSESFSSVSSSITASDWNMPTWISPSFSTLQKTAAPVSSYNTVDVS